jgi:hypothetical protein
VVKFHGYRRCKIKAYARPGKPSFIKSKKIDLPGNLSAFPVKSMFLVF